MNSHYTLCMTDVCSVCSLYWENCTTIQCREMSAGGKSGRGTHRKGEGCAILNMFGLQSSFLGRNTEFTTAVIGTEESLNLHEEHYNTGVATKCVS